MSRKLRFVPEPGLLFHIMNRCLEARYFLRPSKQLNSLIIGVLSRAQQRTGIDVVEIAVMSNHLHLLVVVRDAKQLAEFMHFAGTNIAKEVNRMLGRTGPFWQGRYKDTLIANEEEAQISALRYILEQGCKENLVESPLDWPGVHSSRASLTDEPMVGAWIDRTSMSKIGEKTGLSRLRAAFTTTEALQLSRLPCWKQLSDEAYRAKVRDLVEDIANATRQRHRAAGTRPLGPRRILRQKPTHRPRAPKKSPAPLVRAASMEALKILLEAYRDFVRTFRAAVERFQKDGDRSRFPPGCFPPGGPFVPLKPSPAPG